jgi:hypothetical protein
LELRRNAASLDTKLAAGGFGSGFEKCGEFGLKQWYIWITPTAESTISLKIITRKQYEGLLKWGYPQSSSIVFSDFHEIIHPVFFG